MRKVRSDLRLSLNSERNGIYPERTSQREIRSGPVMSAADAVTGGQTETGMQTCQDLHGAAGVRVAGRISSRLRGTTDMLRRKADRLAGAVRRKRRRSEGSSSRSDVSEIQESSSRQATDYRIYRLSLREWLIYAGQGLTIAAVAAYVCYRSMTAWLLMAPMAVIWPLLMRGRLAARRYRQLELQFRDGILALSGAISAGFSPENAMREAEGELRMVYGEDALIVREFDMMNLQVSMNIPLEKAWEGFAQRTGNNDIENFSRVIRIAKRSGGDLKGIIAHTADVIGDKISIKEEITTMTTGKQFEQKVMELIPVLIVLYIDRSSPGFFTPMYASLSGRLIMTACLGIYACAVWVAGRILNIAV